MAYNSTDWYKTLSGQLNTKMSGLGDLAGQSQQLESQFKSGYDPSSYENDSYSFLSPEDAYSLRLRDFMAQSGAKPSSSYERQAEMLQGQVNDLNQKFIPSRDRSGYTTYATQPEIDSAIRAWGLDPNDPSYGVLSKHVTRSPSERATSVQKDREYIQAQNASKFKPGAFISKGLAPALVGAGFASAFAPSMFGLGETGVSAGSSGGLSSSLGSYLPSTSTLKGAALGAGTGYLSGGDLQSALLGGALGGLGGYVSGGGNIPGFGNIQGASLDQVTGIAGAQGPTQGAGILGKVSGLANSIGGGSSTLGGVSMLGDVLKVGGALYNQGETEDTNEKIRQQLLAAQKQVMGQLSPYQQSGLQANQQLSDALAAGFNPTDLQNDPGYQFRLQQGMQGLQRQLGASGLGQSGAALKAAQEYGQGLASQEYQDAYNRWLGQNQQLAGLSGQGYGAAQNIADLYGDMGGINAQIAAANQENKNKTLAQVLSGAGSLFGRLF